MGYNAVVQRTLCNPKSAAHKLNAQPTIRSSLFARLARGVLGYLRATCPSCVLPPASWLPLVSCVLLLLAACAPQPLTVTREPVALRLVAADSCGLLAEELAAAYEESHPWVTVEVTAFNDAVAERALRAGEADLALLSWLWETASEGPLWSHEFARSGIAVIVHPSTPFAETGLAHLQQIFRGHVQQWGGMVLAVVSREDGSGARAAFEGVVLGDHDVTPNSVVMSSSEAVLEYVARTPGAIGYVSTLWLGESEADRLRVLPVEEALPALDALADGSYPMSHPLYLASTVEPDGEAREFAQWVLGPEGQAIAVRLAGW
jgi:phosphate transport system substrate-binding protein